MDWSDWVFSEWWDYFFHFLESWHSFVRFVMLIIGLGLVVAGLTLDLGAGTAINGIGIGVGAVLMMASIVWSVLAFQNGH